MTRKTRYEDRVFRRRAVGGTRASAAGCRIPVTPSSSSRFAPRRPDQKLIEMAKSHGIPLLCPASVNSDESLAEIGRFGADLHVSMSYDQILREQILSLPPRGTLNCHAGALPFYRGRNPLTWAIINGEAEFGVTVHWVDLGIDTGDIVRQVKTPIKAERYLRHAAGFRGGTLRHHARSGNFGRLRRDRPAHRAGHDRSGRDVLLPAPRGRRGDRLDLEHGQHRAIRSRAGASRTRRPHHSGRMRPMRSLPPRRSMAQGPMPARPAK